MIKRISLISVLAVLAAFVTRDLWNDSSDYFGDDLAVIAGESPIDSTFTIHRKTTVPNKPPNSPVTLRQSENQAATSFKFSDPFGKSVTIRGIVVADEDETPIEGAAVRIYFELERSAGLALGSTVTDSKGRFSIQTEKLASFRPIALQSGDITCRVEAPGFAPLGADWQSFAPDDGDVEFEVNLARGAGLRGRCVDEFGQPITEGTVSATALDDDGDERDTGWQHLLPDGTFSMPVDYAEELRVTVSGPSGHRDLGIFHLAKNTTHEFGDIILFEEGVIEGQLKFKSGEPVVGAYLRAMLDENDTWDTPSEYRDRTGITDEKGKFRICGLRQDASYYIWYAGLSDDAHAPRHRVPFRGANLIFEGSYLTVQVVDEDDVPIEGAQIEVYSQSVDPGNQLQLKRLDSAVTVGSNGIAGIGIYEQSAVVVTASVRFRGLEQQVEKQVVMKKTGLTPVRLVMATPQKDRLFSLSVFQPGLKKTRKFQATLRSLSSGQVMQQLEPDAEGCAQLSVAPGTYLLSVGAPTLARYSRTQPSLIQHDEVIHIPAGGPISREIHLRAGGRINIVLLKKPTQKLYPLFIREADAQPVSVQFKKSTGCTTYIDNSIAGQVNRGMSALLPGRYTMTLNERGFEVMRRHFQIVKNEVTEIRLPLATISK